MSNVRTTLHQRGLVKPGGVVYGNNDALSLGPTMTPALSLGDTMTDSVSLGKSFDPTDPTSGVDPLSVAMPWIYGHQMGHDALTAAGYDDTGKPLKPTYSGGLPIWDPTLASGMNVGKVLADQQATNDKMQTGKLTDEDKANVDFFSHTNIDNNGQLKVDDAGNKTNTDDALKKQKNKAWEMYAVGGAIALGVVLIVASR